MIDKLKICGIIGYYDTKLPARSKLLIKTIMRLIDKSNVTWFIVGLARETDIIIADTILAIKERHGNIFFECVVPAADETESRSIRTDILYRADRITVMREGINNRDTIIADASDYVIALWNGKDSETGDIIHKAMSKEKEVFILNPFEV